MEDTDFNILNFEMYLISKRFWYNLYCIILV